MNIFNNIFSKLSFIKKKYDDGFSTEKYPMENQKKRASKQVGKAKQTKKRKLVSLIDLQLADSFPAGWACLAAAQYSTKQASWIESGFQ